MATWQRQNHIVSLPEKSVVLVRQYTDLQGLDGSALSVHAILERAKRAAAAAAAPAATATATTGGSRTNASSSSAEYRCLETGGFLIPSVSQHPWYKDQALREEKLRSSLCPRRETTATTTTTVVANHKGNHKSFAVLDLGCGLGADARQMLVDGFATNVVGVDRCGLYLRLGCELFGDDPEQAIKVDTATINNNNSSRAEVMSRVAFLASNIVERSHGDEDVAVERMQMVLASCCQMDLTPPTGTILNDDLSDKSTTTNRSKLLPRFDAVYAGKFLHCLETEENLRIVLCKVRKLLVPNGNFFGVFGRTYQPVFECAMKEDFTRVLSSEGFVVAMVSEEAAGATWFCAFKRAC